MKPASRHHDTLGKTGKAQARRQSTTSLVSILSSLTHASGSSGSTATVTQESMARTKTKSSKHTVSSKASSKQRSPSRNSARATTPKAITMTPPTVPNVFAFLDPEQSSANLLPFTGDPSDPTTSMADSPDAPHDEAHKDGFNTSFHSDSGISMPDSSSEKEDLPGDDNDKPPSKQLKPRSQSRAAPVKRRARPSNRVYIRPQRDVARERTIEVEDYDKLPYPEAYYRQSAHSSLIPPMAPQPPSTSQLTPNFDESPSESDTEPQSGYDLLASNLSASTIPPVYRRFTTLNHRILLHLQDEISEMEEELHYLDDAEAQCRAADAIGRPVVPASKRLIPRSQRHSAIFFRRMDLLGRLGMKTEQYNQTLLSFQKASQSLSPATPSCITSYRSWLSAHHPIAEPETRFLSHSDDLIALPPAVSSSLHDTPLALAALVLLPLLAFTTIPNFLGRIVVLGIVGTGVMLYLGNERISQLAGQVDVWRYWAGYLGIMGFVAILV